MPHYSGLVGHGNELKFFPSAMIRVVSRRTKLIYVVKNYSDCSVWNRQRMSKVKAPSTEKRLLWRSGQDELEAWVSVAALRKGRREQVRDGYKGEMSELTDG